MEWLWRRLGGAIDAAQSAQDLDMALIVAGAQIESDRLRPRLIELRQHRMGTPDLVAREGVATLAACQTPADILRSADIWRYEARPTRTGWIPAGIAARVRARLALAALIAASPAAAEADLEMAPRYPAIEE